MGLNDLTIAQQCGIRCRQIRMAKGMSQQELAEKLHVTAAAISKWEKEGISNIDHVHNISNALGQDISADQIDQEGTIGEIGKEIIRLLIQNAGYADFEVIEQNLLGMKADRISNELFKLERIGAAIREQFKDFSNVDRDGVFVTAKGVIAFKNSGGFIPTEMYSNIVTMEKRLGDVNKSFQDIVDSDKVTHFLMDSDFSMIAFRCDYINYLRKYFLNPLIPHGCLEGIYNFLSDTEDLLCGETCYIDILRRMAQGVSVKDIDNTLEDIMLEGVWDDYYDEERLFYEAAGMDDRNIEAVRYFCKVIDSMPPYENIEYSKEDWSSNLDDPDVKKAIHTIEVAEEYDESFGEDYEKYGHEGLRKRMKDSEEAFFESMDDAHKKNSNLWFTQEQVRKFVDENILPPSHDSCREKEIDERLHDLWKTNKDILKYYYSFPKSWEKSGLAQYIRDKVGVPAID